MTQGKKQAERDKSVLDMLAEDARAFFLKPESYCSVDLPSYFVFDKLLDGVSKVVLRKQLSNLRKMPRDHEGVNYTMLSNKDGHYAWRPFQLIHPALYVSLVKTITKQEQWDLIRNRFKVFQEADSIKCLSIPLQASATRKDKAAQIMNWWQGIEQQSIEMSLE